MLNIYFSFGSISQHYKNYMHTEVLLAYCPTTGKIFNLSEKVPMDQKHIVPKFSPDGGTLNTYFGIIHLENWGLCIAALYCNEKCVLLFSKIQHINVEYNSTRGFKYKFFRRGYPPPLLERLVMQQE